MVPLAIDHGPQKPVNCTILASSDDRLAQWKIYDMLMIALQFVIFGLLQDMLGQPTMTRRRVGYVTRWARR